LHFADSEAAYGEFDELERWLRVHRMRPPKIVLP